MRSKLWSPSSLQSRAGLPTMGQMINDQTGNLAPAESQEAMVTRYKLELGL